jgi:hypothetical protein
VTQGSVQVAGCCVGTSGVDTVCVSLCMLRLVGGGGGSGYLIKGLCINSAVLMWVHLNMYHK